MVPTVYNAVNNKSDKVEARPKSDVADPGCFILDPGSEFFLFQIRIKEFKYFNKKMVSKLSEI
jgi:hypothetical protein